METKVIPKTEWSLRASLVVLLCALLGFTAPIVARTPVKRVRQLGIEEKKYAEQRLWDLGYWAGPVDGVFDPATRHALVAFQKVEKRPRTGVLTSTELEALETANRPRSFHGNYAHIEIDLTRQVLFVIDESGTVIRILPVSAGNEGHYVDHGEVHLAHTPRGAFSVLRKINGWRKSTLGLLYYPSYILNGFAVHGSLSVPVKPASHGCIRVPMFAAKELSKLMPVGMAVEVYDS